MATLLELHTMAEVAQHNTSEDCWIVVDGKVYDVSTYLDDHPGGDDVILSATGKDATDDFEDAGHSKTAREEMEKFCIGEIDPSSLPFPKLQIFSKKQASELPKNIKDFTKQYWVVPVAAVGLSLVVGYLYLRKK